MNAPVSQWRLFVLRRWLGVGLLTLLLLLLVFAAAARGQRLTETPGPLADVGVQPKRNAQIPLDLTFRDSRGRRVELAQLFNGETPVILSLTYSDCPMLCHLQLAGLVDTLQEMQWRPGEQFRVVNVSIDPGERPERAAITKQKHLEMYGREGTADGWWFLTGDAENIARLAETVGFQFRYAPERNEYAHAAALIVCTPNGRVSQYLFGVRYPPRTLRLSLVEAGEGKVGGAVDQLLLFCFHYDAEQGRYAPAAFRIMQLCGTLTLVVLLVAIVPYWRLRNRSADPTARPSSASEGDPANAVSTVARDENKTASPST